MPDDKMHEHTHHATDPAEGFDEEPATVDDDEVRVHSEDPAEGADSD